MSRKKQCRVKLRSFKGKNTTDYNTFAEKIICARINYKDVSTKRIGLTLERAAKKIGISTMYLSLLERGERTNPNAVIVRNIEVAYGFKPGELAELLCGRSNN